MMSRLLCAVAAIGLSVGILPAAEPDPLSVVQALMDAEAATDLGLAVSLFEKGAIIVNVAGAVIGGSAIEGFLEADMGLHDDFALEQVSVEQSRVAWSKSIDDPFYRYIGVAPVRFIFIADVHSGRISSISAHVALHDVRRIDAACRQRSPEPLIYDLTCTEFVQLITRQAELAAGRGEQQHARAQHE